jgi:hypothetical protein
LGTPFGFMAFLGIISLVGLIVIQIIALFDFIEEKHAKGEPLKEAVLDAGIMRLRPELITRTRFSDCACTTGTSGRTAMGADVLRTDGDNGERRVPSGAHRQWFCLLKTGG